MCRVQWQSNHDGVVKLNEFIDWNSKTKWNLIKFNALSLALCLLFFVKCYFYLWENAYSSLKLLWAKKIEQFCMKDETLAAIIFANEAPMENAYAFNRFD